LKAQLGTENQLLQQLVHAEEIHHGAGLEAVRGHAAQGNGHVRFRHVLGHGLK
jgi:hypothetical protein